LNETPNSTAELDPLSTVAGTAVLGHMVCCAAALPAQAKAAAKDNSAAPAYLRNFVLDVLVAAARLIT
jgi:hypothetical protein